MYHYAECKINADRTDAASQNGMMLNIATREVKMLPRLTTRNHQRGRVI